MAVDFSRLYFLSPMSYRMLSQEFLAGALFQICPLAPPWPSDSSNPYVGPSLRTKTPISSMELRAQRERKIPAISRRSVVKCVRSEDKKPSECSGPQSPCNISRSSEHDSAMHEGTNRPSPSPPTSQAAAESATITSAAAACFPESTNDVSGTLLLTTSAFLVNGGWKIPLRLSSLPGRRKHGYIHHISC